jgi:hypothetical protein
MFWTWAYLRPNYSLPTVIAFRRYQATKARSDITVSPP